MNIVLPGLSITSSRGNGHATTFRGLVRELAAKGHEVLFLEREARQVVAILEGVAEPNDERGRMNAEPSTFIVHPSSFIVPGAP